MMKLAEDLGRVGGIFHVFDDIAAWMIEFGDVVGGPVDGNRVAAHYTVAITNYQ